MAKAHLARRLPPEAYARVVTLVAQRRPLRLEHPRSFSDLVQRRLLRDRSPELAWTCDKRAMKTRVAASGAVVRIPETLWSGTDLGALPDAGLDGRWVLKRNGSSQLVHFGDGPVTPQGLARIQARFAAHRNPFEAGGEWAYSQAQPGWLVERLLGEPPLADYKVFVFHGRAVLVDVHSGRGGADKARVTLSRTWDPLRPMYRDAVARREPRPEQLGALLAAAEAIGRPFDFLRVDFYLVDGEVWFGETTPYPGAGRTLRDRAFDEWLASLWRAGSHGDVVARERELARFLA